MKAQKRKKMDPSVCLILKKKASYNFKLTNFRIEEFCEFYTNLYQRQSS